MFASALSYVLLATALSLVPLEQENLLENGAVDGPRDWTNTGGGEQVEFEIDRKLGAKVAGSLRIHYSGASDGTAHNWRQMLRLPERDRPTRLELAGTIRVEGADGTSEACIMVQLLPAEGPPSAYGRCPELHGNSDWQRFDTVFDVPEDVERVILMAYFIGPGTCWFDDISLVATDRPLTERAVSASTADLSRYEELARGCAADLPWCFDSAEAFARAEEQAKPILLYVRCTDDREHLDSALDSIEANGIRTQEDGYAKDLLFRAGPLSDPEVRAIIERRFVPVCLTYVLSENPSGSEAPPEWKTGGGANVIFRASASEGDRSPGCLEITNEAGKERQLHAWNLSLPAPQDLPVTLELSASIKAEGFESGSEATVMIQCWKGNEALAYGRVQEVLKDTDWKRQSSKFSVPAGTDKIRVLAYLVGGGRVLFDDIAIRHKDRPEENLVPNGDLARLSSGGLGGFDISAREITTPALIVVEADGSVRRKLHRFGALSSELVDRWLRGALGELGYESSSVRAEELLLDGELERVVDQCGERGDDAAKLLAARAWRRLGEYERARQSLAATAGSDVELEHAILDMRAGDWERAREHLALAADEPDFERSEEARFWAGMCEQRLGRWITAREIWSELASESLFGRRAAACLLGRGPRLDFALSERAWPETDGLPTQTELDDPGEIDVEQSITALLEMQREDGSFGGHIGPDGRGWVDPAISAIVVDALRMWEERLNSNLRSRMEEARERALAYLERWSERPSPGSDAFNNPYVLMTLAEEGLDEAAQRVIARIEANQLDDGNWTVYKAERPASFNTALNIMALARAKKARLRVPKKVLKDGTAALAAMRQEQGHFPYSTAPGHEWMTSDHGSIARDALCEHALLLNGKGNKKALAAALERYARFAHELRLPTKRLYDYFNRRGHGGYFFFFAHRNAIEAAAHAKSRTRKRARAIARDSVLRAREGDGTFVDKFLMGRAYGTAMALLVLGFD